MAQDGLEKLLCGRVWGDGQRPEDYHLVPRDLPRAVPGKQQQQALSFMSFAHGKREAGGGAIVRVERVTRSTTCTSVASALGGRAVKKIVQRQTSVVIRRRVPMEVGMVETYGCLNSLSTLRTLRIQFYM